MRNENTIGTITLRKKTKFTQYSEHAAWTDYVTCESQTVELRYVDGYWCCAKFDGVLTATTFPPGSRTVGDSAQSYFQTQAFGGIGQIIDGDLYSIEITNPAFALNVVGKYSNGEPMRAIQRVPETLAKGGAL